MGMQLYGGGLRLNECLQQRVKDLDFERLQVTVRDGKGEEDRETLLPEAMISLAFACCSCWLEMVQV